MTYTWITPKTDWTYRDKFTYTDYNRIRNNILYINEKINELFPELYMELDLGEPKTSYYDEYFPSEFNKFEDAIISFERTGVNYNIGERYYHYDNDPFVWEDVLNRLETCLLRWKKIDKIAVQSIYLRPHGDEHTLMYIGDSALFDVIIKPSNATKKNAWVLDNDNDMYVSKYLTCEKISDTQVRVTYTKGRGENAYNSGSDADKMFMVEDKNTLTDISGYRCSESIYTNYIRVKVESLKAKCPCHYLAQGSYINRKEDNGKNTRQYYKFTKIADNVDGRGITTFQMTLTDLYAMPWGYENRADSNAPWRKAFDGVHFWAFSKDLRDSMQSVQKEVMSNATAKTNASSKFHLPSWKEFGSDSANVVSLGSAYSYLSGNEITYNGNSVGIEHDNYATCVEITTRSLFNASSLEEEGLSSDKRKALLSSKNSYVTSFKPTSGCGIFPMVFLPSSLKVAEYMGSYKIDWSGTSSIELSDIPLGSVVFDSDGNKGDYSSYNHITAINLNKSSISMKETAVQTITISVFPITAQNVQKLNVYTDIPDKIGLDYSGNTITVTGIKKGIGHIYVEADEFPNELIQGIINIEVKGLIDDLTISPSILYTFPDHTALFNVNVDTTNENIGTDYALSTSDNDHIRTGKKVKQILMPDTSYKDVSFAFIKGKNAGISFITAELDGIEKTVKAYNLGQPYIAKNSSPTIDPRYYLLHDNNLYCIDFFYSKKFYEWNKESIEWDELSTPPYECYYPVAVSFNNQIHLMGGRVGSESCDYHYIWNGSSWIQATSLPQKMERFAVVIYNNEIHVFGGHYYLERNYRDYGRDLYSHYKWDGTEWVLVSTVPIKVFSYNAVVYNNEIHIVNTQKHYKWDGTEWVLVSNFPVSSIYSISVFNDNLYAFISNPTRYFKFNGSSWERKKLGFTTYKIYQGYREVFETISFDVSQVYLIDGTYYGLCNYGTEITNADASDKENAKTAMGIIYLTDENI